MPSDIEIKQFMTERVYPFFNDGELDKVQSDINGLQKKLRDHAELLRSLADSLEELKEQFKTKADKQATVKIDESGRPQVVGKGKSKG